MPEDLSPEGAGAGAGAGEKEARLQEEALLRLKADQRRKAQQLRQSGLDYFSSCQYSLAKQLLTKAASLRDDDMGADFVAETLRYIAMAEVNEGNFEEAIVTLDTYQKIKARIVPEDHDDLIAVWIMLGACRLMGGCELEALGYFEKAKTLLDQKGEETNFLRNTKEIVTFALRNAESSTREQPYSETFFVALSILSQVVPSIPLTKAQETLELYRTWEANKQVPTLSNVEISELAKHLEKRATYLNSESKLGEALMLLEEALELLKRNFEEDSHRVIGLVCKLAEKYIYLKKVDKAHTLLQHWKGQNIRMKQEEEKREKQLEEQDRLSAEAERAREEEKWANNISLHKLEYQVPKISVSTDATSQSTPSTGSDSTRKKQKEPETPLVKKEGNLETHFPPSRNLRFQPISQGKGAVTTPLQIWEDIDANEVLLEDHLAMISFAQGHYEQALQQWLWVLDKKQKIYGNWKNVDIANTLEHLSVVSSRLQKPKHANQYLKKAYEILASTLGSDHKRTQQLHNDLAQRVEGEKLRAAATAATTATAAASRSEDC